MKNVPEIEFQSAETISQFQFEKVLTLLQYLESNSPFYKKLFREHSLGSAVVKSWNDFQKIPTTSKDDLQKFNWEFLCVPRNEIVEYTSTSGTLGRPVIIALTENDIQRLAYNECISFACADGTSEDVYQLMLTLDRQFMAGIAYYEGIRKLGAGLIRVGPGLPSLQWETIERLQPTALVAVPSFIVKLLEFASAHNIDVSKSSVKKIICIGESLRTGALELNTLASKIQAHWGVKLFGTYASTEMQTAFTECNHGCGGHLHPELIYVEILSDDGLPVREGEVGEVTVTTLGVQGMPLLRYRTGDLAQSFATPCKCGRTTLRLGPIVGRKQHMIKLKGTTLFPPAIFNILQQVDFVRDFAVEATTGDLGTDDLLVHVSINGENEDEAHRRLTSLFQSHLRVVPEFKFSTQAELETMMMTGRKVNKFIDRRKK